MQDLTLAAEFPAATRDDWLKLVERVLKGDDIEETLVARTHDGIRIEPLYDKAQGPQPQPLPLPLPLPGASHGPWRIVQRVDHPDVKAANGLALADLQGGADALTLVFPEAASARGFGLDVNTVDDLDEVLRDVKLDLIQLRVEAGSGGFPAASLVPALAERRGHALADLDLDLGLDPIGAMAASGSLPVRWEIVAAQCAETLSRLSGRGFRGRVFLADGRPFHEAGAGEAQELAAVLAEGIATLRALEAGGHSLRAGRDALSFLLAADADQFLTIAKFRALRRLWARIEAACGLDPRPIRLHAETAWRMTTRRDPWINMLRATVAAFSAGIGDADSITVVPFTAALGLPDTFARRIARNTQHILLKESHLSRVADPAAGAGGFEALTDALCETAWSLFQEIEREGGIVASLETGALQGRISAVRAERERAIATRRQPITGTTEFPDLAEAPVAVLLPSPSRRGARDGGRDELRPAKNKTRIATSTYSEPSHLAERPPSPTLPREGGERTIVPLPSIRDAEPYERLRDASDAQFARTGARPKVFLANLGTPADFTARAVFAKNLFEAGGIEAETNDGFATAEAVATAFAASGAKLACLCSSDHLYETLAAPTAKALRAEGARALYIAAHSARIEHHLADAGEVTPIFARCDVLAILGRAIAAAAT